MRQSMCVLCLKMYKIATVTFASQFWEIHLWYHNPYLLTLMTLICFMTKRLINLNYARSSCELSFVDVCVRIPKNASCSHQHYYTRNLLVNTKYIFTIYTQLFGKTHFSWQNVHLTSTMRVHHASSRSFTYVNVFPKMQAAVSNTITLEIYWLLYCTILYISVNR